MSKGSRDHKVRPRTREERLAGELRANLARRKQQAREKARVQAAAEGPSQPAERSRGPEE